MSAYRWIDSTEALIEALAALSDAPALSLDTEFVREKTYYADLGLIQIGSSSMSLLIDPQAKCDFSPMVALFARTGPLKVIHSVGEDLEVLRDRYGAPPELVFDTQIAAGMVGLEPNMSLQKLVLNLLGEQLDKGETRSNWLARPLSAAQLAYAAEDVRVLLPIHRVLSERLRALGREHWLAEDCARLVDKARADLSDPQPHLRNRSTVNMDVEAQKRLWRLLCWRQIRARERNLPKNWVLEVPAAFELSVRAFVDEARFQKHVDSVAPKVARRGAELWQVIHDTSADAGFLPAPQVLTGAQNSRLKELKAEVDRIAVGLSIAPELLANRRILESLVGAGPLATELNGWRGEVLKSLMPTPAAPVFANLSVEPAKGHAE